MFENYKYETVFNLPKNPDSLVYREVAAFLGSRDLEFEEDVEYTVICRDSENGMIGTVSAASSVIKCLAVSEDAESTGLMSSLVSRILEVGDSRGERDFLVFTKPDAAQRFTSLGFRLLGGSPIYSLLETGPGGFALYRDYLEKNRVDGDISAGGVVVNCNPFTNGHLYLLEQAAAACDHLYIFVVEEDFSSFPFKVRFDLVKKGVDDRIDNATVLRGGRYIISRNTFPSYFVKSRNADELIFSQAFLDVDVFARNICPVLGIRTRFVGTEPYCVTTSSYNMAMKTVLPGYDIGIEIIERRKLQSGEVISASKVRELLGSDRQEEAKKYLPKSTYEFLHTEAGKNIVDKLRKSSGRH